jgi:hypothetical protein
MARICLSFMPCWLYLLCTRSTRGAECLECYQRNNIYQLNRFWDNLTRYRVDMFQCRQTMKRKLKQWWSTSSLITYYIFLPYMQSANLNYRKSFITKHSFVYLAFSWFVRTVVFLQNNFKPYMTGMIINFTHGVL